MVNNLFSVFVALLVALTCSVHSEEVARDTAIQAADYINNKGEHHAQKRMAVNNPAEEEDRLILRDDNLEDLPTQVDYMDKRGSLFRFGKREENKRGSLFRFGKRQGALFRFGKRGGALFRFGRSGPAENYIYDLKDSDIDLIRDILAQSESGYSQDGASSKRGIDSFHWGTDSDK